MRFSRAASCRQVFVLHAVEHNIGHAFDQWRIFRFVLAFMACKQDVHMVTLFCVCIFLCLKESVHIFVRHVHHLSLDICCTLFGVHLGAWRLARF